MEFIKKKISGRYLNDSDVVNKAEILWIKKCNSHSIILCLSVIVQENTQNQDNKYFTVFIQTKDKHICFYLKIECILI